MPSAYLTTGSEAAAYGVPNATAQQIQQASLLIDTYLRRPEGLEYIDGADGLPCFMKNLTPSFTITLPAQINPGSNIVINTPAAAMFSQFGNIQDVAILDRATALPGGGPNNAEACVISAITASSITLQSVSFTHLAGATMDFGCAIRIQKTLPYQRTITRVGSWPIVRILSGAGRYAYGRRSDQNAGLYQDYSIMATMQTFGGPPIWIAWNPQASDFSIAGENSIWIPSGIFLAYYSDIKISYIAGFTEVNIPPVVKQVCADIINSELLTADFPGGLKQVKSGTNSWTRFAATVLSEDTKAQLATYRARNFV